VLTWMTGHFLDCCRLDGGEWSSYSCHVFSEPRHPKQATHVLGWEDWKKGSTNTVSWLENENAEGVRYGHWQRMGAGGSRSSSYRAWLGKRNATPSNLLQRKPTRSLTR
jgi:hypothetical protein